MRVGDPSATTNARSEAGSKGARVCTIRVGPSTDDVLSGISNAMAFPDYFGKNWDALDECLRDLSWLPSKGYLLLFENADELLRLPETEFIVLTEVLENAEETWQKEHVPFEVLLVGGDALAERLRARRR